MKPVVPFFLILTLCAAFARTTSAAVPGEKPEKQSNPLDAVLSRKGCAAATDVRKQFTVIAPDQAAAEEIAEIACRTRRSLYAFLNCTRRWKYPAVIKIYPTEEAYRLVMPVEGSGGAAALLSYKGKKMRLILSYNDPMLKHTLRHEIVHLLVADLANREFLKRGGFEEKVPLWFSEGMAEYLTAPKAKRNAYRELVYAAMKKNLAYSMRELISMGAYPENAGLFYAQSYALVAFLAKVPHGPVKLRNFITTSMAFDAERRLLSAFTRDFTSLKSLADAWRMYAARHYSVPETDWKAETFVELSVLYFNNGDYDAAIRCAQTAIDKNPRIEHANYILGMSYYKIKNISAALAAFNRENTISPNSAPVCFMRGVIFWKTGRRSASVSAFVQAAKLNKLYEPILTRKKGKEDINNDVVESFLRFIDREE
jgi:tetratricopeptide (TPR) repeat protein